jgi:hypothetical protein
MNADLVSRQSESVFRGSDNMLNMENGTFAAAQVRRSDRRHYRWLHALAVSCFFIVSVLTRVLPRGLRPFAAAGPRHESCLEEARRVASAVIPYAFEW